MFIVGDGGCVAVVVVGGGGFVIVVGVRVCSCC